MSEEQELKDAGVQEPTPEQIATFNANLKKQREELHAFYKSELPTLKLQAEYENLMLSIDRASFERIQIRAAKMQMFSPDSKAKLESEENEEELENLTEPNTREPNIKQD